MVSRVQELGHRVIERPLRPSLAAVIQDVRANQLVALAHGAARSRGRVRRGSRPSRGSASRATRRRARRSASSARTERGGDVRTGRQGIDVTWHEGDVVAGYQLLAPVSVGAHDDDARVDSAPIAPGRGSPGGHRDLRSRSRHRCCAASGSAAPGLPIALTSQADWRHALVRDQPRCVEASTALDRASRVDVPTVRPGERGGARANPAIVLLGSDARAEVAIDGLAGRAAAGGLSGRRVRSAVACRCAPPARDAAAGRDPPGPVTSWAMGCPNRTPPAGPWHAVRASITPSVVPAGWLVRLASAGSRPANVAVCEIVAGERMLLGQSGVVDDETALEVAVSEGHGWHAPERVRRDVFQWSAAATATATFVLERPVPRRACAGCVGRGDTSGASSRSRCASTITWSVRTGPAPIGSRSRWKRCVQVPTPSPCRCPDRAAGA